jgi:hypothetical protein
VAPQDSLSCGQLVAAAGDQLCVHNNAVFS